MFDTQSIYILSFLFGMTSSLHCLGMCGPLILAMPFQENNSITLNRVFYFTGKTSAYMILGLFIGMIGWGATLLDWQQVISIISGSTLIIVSIYSFRKKSHTGTHIQNWITRIYAKTFSKKFKLKYLTLGFLNGLLPCGMVYIALSTALISHTPLEGALAMGFFGLGTIPILLLIIMMKQKIMKFRKLNYRLITTISTILVGFFMLLRGAALDIPFISPAIHIDDCSVSSCCSKT